LKPANIYLRLDGTPILLDFGAARQTLKTDLPKLYPMYTPGFAAPELYLKNGHLGPWTDIYSIGASIFACMVGAPPQPADQRKNMDKMENHYRKLHGLYSAELIDVVRMCLQIDPLERPQSVFALQKALSTQSEPQKELNLLEKARQKLASLFFPDKDKQDNKNLTSIHDSSQI
jgi:serine/threonine protein kinase